MSTSPGYTTYQLATFMAIVLGEIGEQLGWSGSTPQLVEASVDVALACGVPDVIHVTDLRQLRTFARREAWRAVATATAGRYAFSTDGQRFDRQQVHEHAQEMLRLAEADCLEWESVVHSVRVQRPQDPYQVIPDSERML